MYKILVATDGSDHSWKTVDEAIKIGKAMNAEIAAVTIVEDRPLMIATIPYAVVEEYKKTMEKGARDVLQKTSEYCQEKGVTINTILEHGHPAETICKIAEKGNYDLLVLGHSGLGKIEKMILGSVANKIAHCSKINVLIVK